MGLGKGILPLALYTDYQENGRGQRGNVWNGDVDKNVAITLAFPISSTQNIDVVLLNKSLSVAVLRPLQNLIHEKLFLKWPNDIVTESKKLGGLLMEITQIKQQKFLLLGVGINVNQLDWQNQPKATSLSKICGELFDLNEVMNALLFSLDDIWKNRTDLQADYSKSLWKMGEQVILDVQPPGKLDAAETSMLNGFGDSTTVISDKLISGGNHLQGLLMDVDEEGRIVIADANGKSMAFHHGHVRLQF